MSNSEYSVNAWVYMRQYSWDPAPKIEVYPFKMDADETLVEVGQQIVWIYIPKDFDIRLSQIASLQKKKNDLQAELQQKLTAIDETISRLLALEHSS